MNDLAERPNAELRGPVNVYDPTLENFTEQLHDRIRRDLSTLGTVISISNSTVIHSMSKGTFVDDFTVSVEHPRLRIPIVLRVSWKDESDEIVYTTVSGRTFRPSHIGYGHGVMGERGEEVVDKLFSRLDQHRAITSTEEWKPGMYPPEPKRKSGRITPGATRRNALESTHRSEFLVDARTGKPLARREFVSGNKGIVEVVPERKNLGVKANTVVASTLALTGSSITVAAAALEPISFLTLLAIPAACGITAAYNKTRERRTEREKSSRDFEQTVTRMITGRNDAPTEPQIIEGDDVYNAQVHEADMLWEEHRKAVADWNYDRFKTLSRAFDNAAEMAVFTDALMALCDAHGVEYLGRLSVTDKVASAKRLTRPKTEMLDEPAYSLKGTIRTYMVGFQGNIREEGVARWIYFDGRHLFETIQGSGAEGNPFHRREAAICPL